MKRTPLLIQERPLQYARKAYSRTLKGMFSNVERHVLKSREACGKIEKSKNIDKE